MNLFRSEEHVRNWPQFNPESAEGVISVGRILSALGLPPIKEPLRRLLQAGLLLFRRIHSV